MAASNFDPSFNAMIRHEGGYVDHPADPGGATNLGVTIGTLSAWLGRRATKAEVKALTVETVKPIYRKNYWNTIGGDGLPIGLDYCLFDVSVNSGPGKARQFRAETAGKFAKVTDEIKAVCARRRAFFQSLKTFKTFGKGWMRRVAEVEALAIKMALAGSTIMNPAQVNEALRKEAMGAGDTAKAKTKQAKAAGGASAAGGAATAAGGWDWQLIAFGCVCVAVIGFVGFLAWRAAKQERERMSAFLQEAANG